MFAVAISVSFYRSGGGTDSDGDIFIALFVFLPLATLVSTASIGSNIWLLLRQAVSRRTQLRARRLARPTSAQRLRLAWLVGQLMLRRDEDKHLEKASRNEIVLRQFSLGVLLLLLEDIPFFAIQLTLIRTNQAQVELFLFLNMLKTSGMLATKLQHLKSLPGLLKKRRALRAERVELDQRAAQLQIVHAARSSAGDASSESDSESTGLHCVILATMRVRAHACTSVYSSADTSYRGALAQAQAPARAQRV